MDSQQLADLLVTALLCLAWIVSPTYRHWLIGLVGLVYYFVRHKTIVYQMTVTGVKRD